MTDSEIICTAETLGVGLLHGRKVGFCRISGQNVVETTGDPSIIDSV
jgi:hypothetical protein